MSSLKEEELTNILPKDGPTVEEVKKYLEKYNDEFIIIKCGGSVLVDPKLFKIFMFFPVFITVILAPFPAGLVIYWSFNNIFTMIQQYIVQRKMTVKTT